MNSSDPSQLSKRKRLSQSLNIRQNTVRLIRFILQPQVLLFILLTFIVYQAIDFGSFKHQLGILFILPMLPLKSFDLGVVTGIGISSAVYGFFGYTIYKNGGIRHTIRTTIQILIGKGWDAWAMFWIWIIVVSGIPVFGLAMLLFGRRQSYSLPIGNISILIGLIIFQIAVRRYKRFPWREALFAGVMAIVTNPILQVVEVLIKNLDTSVTGDGQASIVTILVSTIVLLMMLFVVPRRTGFDSILRLLMLTVVGAVSISLILFNPTLDWIYTHFVPNPSLDAITVDNAFIQALQVSALVTVIIGGISAFLVRSSSALERLLIGTLVGALVGTSVAAIVGGWSAGIVAHSPLYGFVLSRVGFNDAEWLLKLGIAVNNTLPMTLFTILAGTGIGAVLAGIGGLIIPIRQTRQPVPDGLPLWAIVSTITIPFLQMGILLNIVILILLGPAVNNILIVNNYQPQWSPDWTAPALSLPLFIVMALMMVSLRRWLDRTYVQSEGQSVNGIFLNTLFISGLLTALGGFMQIIANSSLWWSVIIGSFTLGMGIELMRLSRVIPRTTQALTNRRRWISAGMLSGFIIMLLNWILIAGALSLTLIAVVLIVDLSQTTEPPPGIDLLFETLEVEILLHSSILSFASVFLIVSGFISFILVMNIPAILLTTLQDIASIFYNRLPQRLQNPILLKVAMGGLALIIDVFIIMLPVLTFLSAVAFIRRDHLYRMPQWILAAAYVVVGLFVMSFPIKTQNPDTVLALILVILAVSSVVVYHLITLYIPPKRHSWRYITMTIFLGVFLATMLLIQEPIVTGQGGISRYDGSTWIAYNQDNSNLGTNIPTAMLSRNDGNMWFANSGGTISIYDGQLWEVASVAGIRVGTYSGNINSQRLAELTQEIPYLVEGHNETVWYASGAVIGRVVVNLEGVGAYDLESMCDQSIINMAEASDSSFCSLATSASGKDYRQVTMTTDGDLWFTVDSTAYRLVAGEVVPMPFEANVPISPEISPTLITSPTAIPTVNESEATATIYTYQTPTPEPTLVPTATRVPINVEASAPLNHVNAIATSNDIVWLATDSGLYRFTDDLEQPEIVANQTQEVTFVAVDAQDAVWFTTTEGLHKLNDDSAELVITATQLQLSVGDTQVNALTTDNDGTLWIGTKNGLLQYRLGSGVVAFVLFTSANSGLTVDNVLDVLIDNDGNVWVSTFDSSQTKIPSLILFIIGLSFWGLVGGSIYRDYTHTPKSRGNRMGKQMAESSDTLYEQIYDYLATQPDIESINAVAHQLTQAGLPNGGASLLALSQPMVADEPQLESIAMTLDTDTTQKWAQSLSTQYRILHNALNVQSVADITNLELRISPNQSTQTSSIITRTAQVESLPSFVASKTEIIWKILHDVSITLSKFAQVNDTGDRLSYLASALVEVESAQSRSSDVPAPDGQILQAVIGHWRTIITETINTLSGSADLRLELRTRQIKREQSTTLVLKLDNIGQSAAENIRIVLLNSDPSLTTDDDSTRRIERLSPNRTETVEFTINPPDADRVRTSFQMTWDDRLDTDKLLEYADEIRFFDTETEFVPIANPYIVGHPVKQQGMFFGREDVFQFIEENISGSVQDRTIVLYGQRRTGKTSLLYQLINGRLGEQFIPVLIDMQAVILLIDSTADFFGELLYQLEQTLEDTNIDINFPTIDEDTKSPLRVFDRFLAQLSQALGERRILIIFDEFELIESKIADGKLDADLLSYFRSLIQHRDSYVFMFAGTHQLEDMSHDYWSILFNIALTHKITFMNEQETINLIRQPVAGSLSVDDLAIEKIIRLTNKHPYFTQLLCWALVNQCNMKQNNYATINDVNDAVEMIMTTGESHFAYIWQQSNNHEQLLLAILAHHADSGIWMTPDEIEEILGKHSVDNLPMSDIIATLDALTRSEIVEATVDMPLRYRFRLDILRLWVRRNKSMQSTVERLRLDSDNK